MVGEGRITRSRLSAQCLAPDSLIAASPRSRTAIGAPRLDPMAYASMIDVVPQGMEVRLMRAQVERSGGRVQQVAASYQV